MGHIMTRYCSALGIAGRVVAGGYQGDESLKAVYGAIRKRCEAQLKVAL